MDYFIENRESYNEFLVQSLIKGFKKYGEIKTVNKKFSPQFKMPKDNLPN